MITSTLILHKSPLTPLGAFVCPRAHVRATLNAYALVRIDENCITQHGYILYFHHLRTEYRLLKEIPPGVNKNTLTRHCNKTKLSSKLCEYLQLCVCPTHQLSVRQD